MYILSDFDRTLTYSSTNGVKTPSIISLLSDGNHLSKEYSKRAYALYEKYSSFENDTTLTREEREKIMHEWWQTILQLLIRSELNIKDLVDIVESGMIRFRESVPDILDLLKQKNIPLIIYSASGCGEAVPMYFEKIKKKYSNIFFIINRFKWDSDGRAISIEEPIITSANKNGNVLIQFPNIAETIKKRTNIILLGDSLDDIEMANGIKYKLLFKIGLLGDTEERNRKKYNEVFDVLLEDGDGLMYIKNLLRETN